jgi:5-formyltetrahydrofolate cyclo-ligase
MPSGDSAKALLRAAARGARETLDAGFRARASAAIAARLADLPAFAVARTVALYAPIGSEVATAAIEAAVRLHNGLCCYPRVEGEHLSLLAAWADELSPTGRLRIPEPPPDREREVPPGEIDLYVVPLVAVDAAHLHIGYGRGFYDRVLAIVPAAIPRIGLAFEAQIVPQVPSDPHDVPLTAVVTETRIL